MHYFWLAFFIFVPPCFATPVSEPRTFDLVSKSIIRSKKNIKKLEVEAKWAKFQFKKTKEELEKLEKKREENEQLIKSTGQMIEEDFPVIKKFLDVEKNLNLASFLEEQIQ